jgi:hypothetical protein
LLANRRRRSAPKRKEFQTRIEAWQEAADAQTKEKHSTLEGEPEEEEAA